MLKDKAKKSIENMISESVKTIDLRLNTVILLVGPSGCGKSYFAENHLIPQLRAQESDKKRLNIQYISSDNTRRELLGEDSFHKMDNEMMYVSKQAFQLLYTKLRAVTSYPVNSDVVIVDTTGLAKEFRQDVIDIANENNYNVACIVFDFKNRDDYYTYVEEESLNKRVTSRHLEKMRKNTMRELNKRDFYLIEKVKDRDFSKLNFNIKDLKRYEEHVLPVSKNGEELEYTVIGDVHGCFTTFKALLEKLGFEINKDGYMTHENMRKRIVLVGDLIDKGPDSGAVIDFVHKNLSWFHYTIGNHENFVYKFITGQIPEKHIPDEVILNDYFEARLIFEKDEELKEKFIELIKDSKHFFIHRDFIVTHAPCENKHLAKLSGTSLKAQRSIRYPKDRDYENPVEHFKAVKDFFKFLRDDAEFNGPLHIFGHVTSKEVSNYKNKWNIDTGAYTGNKLSAITINPGGKPFITSVSAEESEKFDKPAFSFFQTLEEEKVVDIENDLSPKEYGRIKWAAKNKVNFISGTVSPSDKNEETNTLESLDEALKFFKDRKVEKVVIQPKYMGSRCNIYLHKDLEKSYATTRNGHLIDYVDMNPVFEQLHKRAQFRDMFDNQNVEIIMLDSELMPWSALGKRMIENDFVSVEKALTSEIEFLKENGFEEALMDLYNGPYKESKYEEIYAESSKKEIAKALGSTNARTFSNLKDYMKRHIPLSEMEKGAKVYSRQLELYGQDSEIHAKPFSLLKLVYVDGSEKLFFDDNNEDIYKTVSDDNFITIDLSSEKGWELAREFYQEVTEKEEMEGVMVKPYKVFVEGLPPCLKVRNPRYLTIVFGYDYRFHFKHEKLIKRKRIRRKLKTSIKEWAIGKRLLEVPYREISLENDEYTQSFAKMIFEEKVEKTLDPRL
jgi:predicted kinase